MQNPRLAPWPPALLRRFTPRESYRVAMLTWGTRGDVQPFVALGAELRRRGHSVTIAARAPFRGLVERHGLGFFEMPEDGTDELMEVLARSRGGADGAKQLISWTRRLAPVQFERFWRATEDADVLVTNAAYTTPAVHIAQARGIPLFPAFFDPGFVPSRGHTIVADRLGDRGPLRNLLMTRARNAAIGLVTWDVVNRWRLAHRLRPVLLGEVHAPRLLRRLPVLVAWSAALVGRPADWPPWFEQTGRWELAGDDHVDPALRAFVESDPPPVYVGFGSWGVHDRTAVTDAVLTALASTGNRGVLQRNTVDGRASFPDGVHVADELPHDWLLPRTVAIVHHGGAGTTGAAVSAGRPSIVVPAFYAQNLWGDAVARLGIGTMLERRDLDARSLAAALTAVGAPAVRERARLLGEQARAEGGVTAAADAIERNLRP